MRKANAQGGMPKNDERGQSKNERKDKKEVILV
jgi:hypothetical protein